MSNSPLLSRLDLNLLISLDALLTERSVTRAAERLYLSQPELSASLARLRTHFDDPILARRGNSYELTPLAVRLSEHTAVALEAARRVFESQATWDPEQSTREFTVYGSDYSFATVGREASRLASSRAPGVQLRFMLHNTSIVQDASTRLRSVDAMLIPHGFLHDLRSTDLWTDRWVGIRSADGPEDEEPLQLEDLGERPWVLTWHARDAFTSAARQIQQLGIEQKVEAVVESFLALGHFIEGTRRLGLVQESLAAVIEGSSRVRRFELPFEATPILNALWWHPMHDRDPEHEWLREIFVEASARCGAPTA